MRPDQESSAMTNPQRDVATTGVVGVGYEGRSVVEFVGALRADRVRIVVDARLTARCDRRGFSRHALADELRAGGIEYVHYEILGNPEHNQAGFRGPAAAVAAAAAQYREHLARPAARQVLRDLIAVSAWRRVAVMTTEADPERCHRATLLAEIARVAPQPRAIDEVLSEYAEPEPEPAAATPVDTRTRLERDIDALLAEFSPSGRAGE
jgi:uncharacterized protein DUF488